MEKITISIAPEPGVFFGSKREFYSAMTKEVIDVCRMEGVNKVIGGAKFKLVVLFSNYFKKADEPMPFTGKYIAGTLEDDIEVEIIPEIDDNTLIIGDKQCKFDMTMNVRDS